MSMNVRNASKYTGTIVRNLLITIRILDQSWSSWNHTSMPLHGKVWTPLIFMRSSIVLGTLLPNWNEIWLSSASNQQHALFIASGLRNWIILSSGTVLNILEKVAFGQQKRHNVQQVSPWLCKENNTKKQHSQWNFLQWDHINWLEPSWPDGRSFFGPTDHASNNAKSRLCLQTDCTILG